MAYMKPLYRRKCADCSKFATRTLCNRFNEELNYYCSQHGGDKLAALKGSEAPTPAEAQHA